MTRKPYCGASVVVADRKFRIVGDRVRIEHHGGAAFDIVDRAAQAAVALMIGAEALVETTVGVVAQQRDRGIHPQCAGTGDQDPPIRLHRQRARPIDAVAEIGEHPAIMRERGVEAAIDVVAGQCDVAVARVDLRLPGHHDAAVGLQRHAEGQIIIRAHVGQHPTATAEAGIETAINVVTRQREIVADAVVGDAGGDDPAVGLQRQAPCRIRTAGKIGQYFATDAERHVQRAVAVVAQQREVAGLKIASAAGDHDPAIALQHCAVGSGAAGADRGDHLAAVAETGIDTAVGIQAQQREIAAVAGQHNAAIGLQRDAPGDVVAGAEHDDHLAANAETAIEAAVGGVAGEREIVVDAVAAAPGHQHATIGRGGDRVSTVDARTNGGGDPAGLAEGGIELAVGAIARQREIAVGVGAAAAGQQDAAVSQHRQGVTLVIRRGDRAGIFAAMQVEARRVVAAAAVDGQAHGQGLAVDVTAAIARADHHLVAVIVIGVVAAACHRQVDKAQGAALAVEQEFVGVGAAEAVENGLAVRVGGAHHRDRGRAFGDA